MSKSAANNIFFVFDDATLELLHPYIAQESPLEPGVFIAPTNSTQKTPPPLKDGKAIFYEFEPATDGKWVYKDDIRGIWYKPDGTQVEVKTLLETVESDWTRTQPAKLPAQIAAEARMERDRLIESVTWRFERNAREQRLGLDTTDDIAQLDAYVQALANVPNQPGFPKTIEWPQLLG